MDTYEKKYKDALERAKAYHRNELAGSRKEMTEYIFPELRESEDERMRRMLIDRLRSAEELTDQLREWILSCLEKQEDCILVPKSHLDPVGKLGVDGMKIFEEQKEQKPAEWNANDKAFIKDCARILDENGYAASAERLLSMFPVKPVEWSEEDRKILDDVSHILAGLNYKQVAQDYKQAVEKLIYARPSWKPSDEQMEALNALNCHGALSYVGQQKQLISLYNDLKKLM